MHLTNMLLTLAVNNELKQIIDNNLMAELQYEFRKGHSAELAATKLTEIITSEMNNFKTAIAIYFH